MRSKELTLNGRELIVYEDGRVYQKKYTSTDCRTIKGRFLKRRYGHIHKNLDYYSYCINRKKFYAHRIVAIAFIPNPKNKPEINHIDSNPENNHVSNLEWCTHKENIMHAKKYGKMKVLYNEDSPRAKLTNKQVLEIKKRYSEGGFTHKSLAKEYNVGRTTITAILNKQNWSI